MELTHSFTVPTSVDDAWALFMDLERVGGCFPGATVTEVTDDTFSGTVKVKLGPIALVYTGSGAFVERDDAAHHAVIEAKGKDKRGNGTAGATVSITLSPDGGGGGARADVVTDLAVTGKPAQFGRGVMQDVSDKLLQAFVACIEKQLTGPAAAPEPEVPVAAAASTAYVETGSDALAADTGAPRPAAPAAAAHEAHPPRRVPADLEEDAPLDLGSTVMPVLIQRYAGYAVATAIGIVIGWLIGRGSSSGG
ncbi:SRPBCC family protein [Terrabacter sp. 2YAF2]|uniref:SRPBCC family protein n=1 Tax=Terrabacter sp. 2YAF2 TaxID=3233026 RepID=UPI003F9C21CE